MLRSQFAPKPVRRFDHVCRHARGARATPDGLHHTPWREGHAVLEPVELVIALAIEHQGTRRLAIPARPSRLLVVRLRCSRHGPVHHQAHVGLVDAEAERGAYTIEMRSLWGFDAQVASGKLRECAGCAPQGDTEVDTLCC